MTLASLISLILLLLAITAWFCIYLLYLRIKATPHDLHLLYSHSAPTHRVHFEVYRSQEEQSKWNVDSW